MSTILSILAAAEAAGEHAVEHEEHKSEAPFFIAGCVWALFAVVISVVGFKRPDFPNTDGAIRGLYVASVFGWMTAVSMAIYVAL
jgi:hypothetical protein